MLSLDVPALGEARLALALEGLAAHRRGEHPALAPAPDFLAGEILDDEIVGLSVGESELEHLAGVIAHVQREAELVGIVFRSGDVESRDDGRALLRSGVPGSSDRF